MLRGMRHLHRLVLVLGLGCGGSGDGEVDAAMSDAGDTRDAGSADAAPARDAMANDAATPDAGVPVGPIGWASVAGMGLETTTGGGDLAPTVVTTIDDFRSAVAGTEPAVVRIDGSIEGNVDVGSNKTIEGAPGATFRGSLVLDEQENVILRHLTIVGWNCEDDADCGSGADAITVYGGTHHLWIHHCDISDGSDGNLDITRGSDFVTVAWTRFSYSGRRDHQLSNLVGASDSHTDDAGHLAVTWHHNHWAENVIERMPRVRFGQNHLFNNLYTSTDNNYCVGIGASADVLLENNVFRDVDDPIQSTSYSDENSKVESRGNLYIDVTGDTDDLGSGVFTPPYPYTLDDADEVEAIVRAGVGP